MTLYLDMDGTFCDLYAVDDWKAKLNRKDPSPYLEAEPMFDMEDFTNVLIALQKKGYRIGIISHLSMNSCKYYKEVVRAAKRLWLHQHIGSRGFVFDEMHFIQYGVNKRKAAKDKNGILFDDNIEVLMKWKGHSSHVVRFPLLPTLKGLL